MSGYKVDMELIGKMLVDGIQNIDGDDSLTRSDKTKQLKRLADKVKTKLHEDGRKSEDQKIALSTYRKYMTQLRRKVTAMNLVHHSLEKQITSIGRKHPEFADSLNALLGLGINDLRLSWKELLDRAQHDTLAYESIRGMKLDHEIMRHLNIPEAKKARLGSEQSEKLELKKHNTITINYHRLVDRITSLLTEPQKSADGKTVFSYGDLAFGIALATGRRSVEVLYQGEFLIQGDDEDVLIFSGQAKRRGGADYRDEYPVYTLVNRQLVVDALERLREMPEVVKLEEFEKLPEVERNTMINRRCARATNDAAKRALGDDDRVFKDSRAIWARCVHDLFYRTRKEWKKKDEDIFFREMLGHQDVKTQQAYKQFKLDMNELPGGEEKTSDRLAMISELDGSIHSKALVKIHEYVKEKLEVDPFAKITQSLITKELGSGRPVIQRYLDIEIDGATMKDFLGTQPMPSPIIRKETTIIEEDPSLKMDEQEQEDDYELNEDDIIEDDEELFDDEDELEPTPEEDKKPRIKSSLIEGFVHVVITLGKEVVVDFKAKGERMEVIKLAWSVFESLYPDH